MPEFTEFRGSEIKPFAKVTGQFTGDVQSFPARESGLTDDVFNQRRELR